MKEYFMIGAIKVAVTEDLKHWLESYGDF